MKTRIASAVIPAYVLLCILFGGSAQGMWTNVGLQLCGIALLAWTAVAGERTDGGRRVFAINLLLVCGLLLVLVQLLPLPAGLWTKLPGRSEIVQGLAALGYPVRSFSISEAPFSSVLALFAAIPAIAIFLATERLEPSPRAIAAAIVAGMIAAIFIGALQVAGGSASWAYFYEDHSRGAIGFFANGNHMATLLLVGMPMAAALAVSAKSKRNASKAVTYGLGAALCLLVVLGIVLNGSRAAIALSLPVAVASAALFPGAARWRWAALGASLLALVGAVVLVMSNPITSTELEAGAADPSAAVPTRGEIWDKTSQAIADSWPVGTGLGTFQQVFHRYENPEKVNQLFVNHAHNDYLEVALELGLGGIILLALFLGWWGIVAVRIWQSALGSPFQRAATIATGAILAHGVVDFPLRTASLSAVFAACVALMAQHLRPAAATETGDLRPTRHVSLG